MKYDIAKYEGRHYQPLVTDSEFWTTLDAKYLSGNTERMCVDRIRAIFGRIKPPGTLLDIGCNIGLFTHYAHKQGFQATGIENDYHVAVKRFTDKSAIGTAKALNAIYGLTPEFIEGDYIKEVERRAWDYVLYLSVWHHHLMGYGRSELQRMSRREAEGVLKKVWAATKKAMIFEMDGFMWPVVLCGWGQWRIKKNLKRLTGVEPVAIFESPDGWAHPRTIWLLEKK